MDTYPAHNWLPWKFTVTPPGFWNQQHNRKRFLEWLGTELKYKSLEDYYKISTDQISFHGGAKCHAHLWQAGLLNFKNLTTGKTLVKKFNASLRHILHDGFPEHQWQWWKLKRAPSGYWASVMQNDQANEILLNLTDAIARRYGIKALEEWYRISIKDLGTGTEARIIRKLGGLPAVLRIIYPKHEWDPSLFKSFQKRSVQSRMGHWLKRAIPPPK